MNGYLMYEDDRNYVGMYHCLLNLQAFMKEAIYLNRIPVIMPPLLHSKHNLGVKLSCPWPKYLNISQTEVFIKENGNFMQMQTPFQFVLGEDFKQLKFDEGQIYRIGPHHQITEAENRKFQLIVRSVSSIFWGRWWRAAPEINKKMRINLARSDDVKRISKSVIDRLGWYAAIHVRRGDKLRSHKKLKKFTSPKHILNTVKNIVPLHSNVYILTDEKDNKFFDYLRKHYKIYQFFDFHELMAIISGNEPDNNFLFLAERCIYENAAVKIGTFKAPKEGFWPGGDYSLSKYNRLQYSTNYKLRRYLALMHSFLKSFRKHPFSFKSKFQTFKSLTSEFFWNRKSQKK